MGWAYISVAERDGPWSVQSGLEGEGPLWFSTVEPDALPLHHKHLTWAGGRRQHNSRVKGRE